MICWFLLNEYRFFKQQSEKLIELQDDYRNYINVLRKVFDSQKAVNNEVESIIEEKKKPFVVINREKQYLKNSFFDYLNKKKLTNLLKHFEKDFRSTNKEKLNSKNWNKRYRFSNRSFRFAQNKESKKGIFMWPLSHKDFWISSFFGLRKVSKGYSFHYGIDMAAIKGTIVRAASNGQVKEAFYSPGYGNTVLISHDSKYKTRYAHLNSITVKNNDIVQKGQIIGTVGDTGSVRASGKNKDASHLHFEVYVYGKRINPLYVLH